MTHIETLSKFIGLFEEYLDKAPELIEKDNFADYREAVEEINKLSEEPYRPTAVFRTLEELEKELPFSDEINFLPIK